MIISNENQEQALILFFNDQKAFQCERGCYYVQRGSDHSFQPDWLHVTVALYVVTEGREEYDKEDVKKMKRMQ